MARLGRPSKYLPKLMEAVDDKVNKRPGYVARDKQRRKELSEEIKEEQAVESGIDLQKMTKEQVAKLVQDFTRKDAYNLAGLNPAYRYRFINRSEDRLNRQTMRGWEIVGGAEAIRIAKASKVTLRQGQIIHGDGVLAKIPMEVYAGVLARLKELNQRTVKISSSTLRRDMGSKYSRNVEESLNVREGNQPEKKII